MNAATDGLRATAGSEAGEASVTGSYLPPGPVVKVCGLNRVVDVVAAAAIGAWAVGFVFAASPRRLTPVGALAILEQARESIEAGGRSTREAGDGRAGKGRGPLTVGVFTDATPDEIAAVACYVGLDAIQLHGESAPSTLAVRRALGEWRPPLKLAVSPREGVARAGVELLPRPLIIRAVGVALDECDVVALRRRLEEAGEGDALVLIDARVPGRAGGTGERVPWEVVGEAALGIRYLLAGGIRPDNVNEALTASGAWGVDVSSGVESAPGVKRADALERLLRNVKRSGLVLPGSGTGVGNGRLRR